MKIKAYFRNLFYQEEAGGNGHEYFMDSHSFSDLTPFRSSGNSYVLSKFNMLIALLVQLVKVIFKIIPNIRDSQNFSNKYITPFAFALFSSLACCALPSVIALH